MEQSDQSVQSFKRRLLLSRMRLLSTHGFFGLLLMNMRFRLTDRIETAATDGTFIYFSPEFLEELNDKELDFVLLHEVMHAALHHCSRMEDLNHERFNIACDIVVNSTILEENNMDLSSISVREWGVSMHLTPSGEEGYLYSAEQVYGMLSNPAGYSKKIKGGTLGSGNDTAKGGFRDDHTLWSEKEDQELRDVWTARVVESARAVERRDPGQGSGHLPRFAQRILQELTNPRIDWRTILREFLQPDINDYSFSPPDRRFGDSPFFLPDFNERNGEGDAKDILFMVDTSGSISDKMLAEACSEIRGAIDQFGGRLRGWLGFFDAEVIPPEPFDDEETVKKIRPKGGGGTNFHCIFRYVREKMTEPPVFIVIFTDGGADYPEESMAMGIPVLWLLNNEFSQPPWGKVAHMPPEEND